MATHERYSTPKKNKGILLTCLLLFVFSLPLQAEDILSYFDKANDYFNDGQYEKAIQLYTKAISMNPNIAEIYFNRGLAYDRVNKYSEAIEDYNTVISMNPDIAEAYHNRGIAYSGVGKYNEAVADFDKALALRPRDVNILYSRGIAFLKKGTGDFQKACELGRRDACDDLKKLSELLKKER